MIAWSVIVKTQNNFHTHPNEFYCYWIDIGARLKPTNKKGRGDGSRLQLQEHEPCRSPAGLIHQSVFSFRSGSHEPLLDLSRR
jgi:hypothetical protein